MLLVLHSSQIQVGRFLEVLTQMLDEASQTAGDEEQNGAYLRVFHFFTQMFRKLLAEQQQSTSSNSFNFDTTTPTRPSAAVVEAGVPLPALSVSATTSASSGDDLEFLKARPLSTVSAAGARTGRGVPAGVVLSASTSEGGMNKGKSSNPQAPESWSSPTADDNETCSEKIKAAGSTTSLQQFRQQLLTTTHLLSATVLRLFPKPALNCLWLSLGAEEGPYVVQSSSCAGNGTSSGSSVVTKISSKNRDHDGTRGNTRTTPAVSKAPVNPSSSSPAPASSLADEALRLLLQIATTETNMTTDRGPRGAATTHDEERTSPAIISFETSTSTDETKSTTTSKFLSIWPDSGFACLFDAQLANAGRFQDFRDFLKQIPEGGTVVVKEFLMKELEKATEHCR
ncbi:unnamed protein product, partial [Amoebophrya sp. A120]|eukprot:GSA120T00011994001.1